MERDSFNGKHDFYGVDGLPAAVSLNFFMESLEGLRVVFCL